MNLAKKYLWPYLLLSIALHLIMPLFHSSFRVSFLVPLLVILYYQKPLIFCLWMSFLCGLLLDLLSSERFFGIYTSSYCCATALIYPQKKHFFADNLSTLPLLTFFTSGLITGAQILLIYIFQRKIPLNWYWFATNILIMPLVDSMYAFFLFLMPSLLFGKRRRHGKDYFIHRPNLE